MKKNIYYRTMYIRKNPIKEFLTDMFYKICTYPRAFLEVFIRKNFGERYFSIHTCLTLFACLFFLPLVEMITPWNYRHPSFSEVLFDNITWYIFLGIYLVFSFRRKREIKRIAAEFDFKKFTRYSGDIMPEFFNAKFRGEPVSFRTVETIIEPLFFFVIGITLLMFAQKIGIVIALSSIFYSLSYFTAYWRGDTIILDIIDEIIANDSMFDLFMDSNENATKDGFRIIGDRPSNPKLRTEVASNIIVGEDEAFEVI